MSRYKNEKLDKIYKTLPRLECKKLCQASCSIIPIGAYEKKRIEKIAGKQVFLEPEEILENIKNHDFKIECPLLKDGKCTVHFIRPLICRLFGMVEKMKCPYGCIPERWLTDHEAKILLIKANYFEKIKEI